MTSRAERKRTRKAATIARAKAPKATVTVIEFRKPAENPLDRDGLVFLRKKGRISSRRLAACIEYRMAGREPPAGAMRSCLDDSPRGGGSGSADPGDYNASSLDAQRRLHTYRSIALKGVDELIRVMDGIARGGLTPREMAGGDSRQAAILEAVLYVAADLLAQHLDQTRPVKKQA